MAGTATARKYGNAPGSSPGNAVKNPPHAKMMAHAIADFEANGIPMFLYVGGALLV